MNDEQARLYIVNPDVSCREEGADGALLFNPDTDEIVVVNPTGLLIWQALSEPRDQEQAVAVLMAECQGIPDPAVLQQDVEEFLQDMLARGFIGLYQGTVT